VPVSGVSVFITTCLQFLSPLPKETFNNISVRDHSEDLGVDGRKILKRILEDCEDWIQVTQM
jgi:hypothetical protein